MDAPWSWMANGTVMGRAIIRQFPSRRFDWSLRSCEMGSTYLGCDEAVPRKAMRRTLACVAAIAVIGIGSLFVWTATLPRLDPTGTVDSSAALRSMIKGRSVYLVGACPRYKPWACVLTKDDYEQPEGDRK